MPMGDVAPQLALVLGAVLCLLSAISLPRRLQWVGAPLAAVTCAVAAGFAWHLQATAAPTLSFDSTWAIDGLTTWATLVICGTTALVAALSPRWFATDRRHGEWYAVLLFSALGAVLLAGASDIMELMVAMLLASVTGYTLASYHRESPTCAEAGAKYFLMGALTNSLLFLGIVLLYGISGTTRYAALQATLGATTDPLVAGVAVVMVVLGVAFELGAVPVHAWVPDVSEASPVPAAAFLTVAPKVGALAALARFLDVVPGTLVSWPALVAVLAVLTMTVGNLAALWQTDLRRLLGWSSVSQAGYGLLAVAALGGASGTAQTDLALPALVTFIVGYALANVAAFAVVASLRGRTAFEDYEGLAYTRPWHAAALIVAMLSLIGVPILIGFVAKLALFGAALEAGFWWLALVAVINTVISVFYYFRVVARMVLEEPPSTEESPALLGWAPAAVAMVCALGLLAVGVGAEFVLEPEILVEPIP